MGEGMSVATSKIYHNDVVGGCGGHEMHIGFRHHDNGAARWYEGDIDRQWCQISHLIVEIKRFKKMQFWSFI